MGSPCAFISQPSYVPQSGSLRLPCPFGFRISSVMVGARVQGGRRGARVFFPLLLWGGCIFLWLQLPPDPSLMVPALVRQVPAKVPAFFQESLILNSGNTIYSGCSWFQSWSILWGVREREDSGLIPKFPVWAYSSVIYWDKEYKSSRLECLEFRVECRVVCDARYSGATSFY